MPLSEKDKRDVEEIEKHFRVLVEHRCSEFSVNMELFKIPSLAQAAFRFGMGLDSHGSFACPGMYGGFSFHFERDSDGNIFLVADSSCRVAGGSLQIAHVTPTGLIRQPHPDWDW